METKATEAVTVDITTRYESRGKNAGLPYLIVVGWPRCLLGI
jgi:hypothetical protein